MLAGTLASTEVHMPRPAKDLTALRKRHFSVLYRVGTDERSKAPLWRIQCDCGAQRDMTSSQILGNTQSCGCKRLEDIGKAKTVHGMNRRIGGRSRVYRIWAAMKARCTNPNTINFDRYGGAGVTVCERWQSFENFLADMGEPPTPTSSIDRIDSGLGYQPGNCRWASLETQAQNKQSGLDEDAVRFIRANPQLKLRDLAERFGVTEANVSLVRRRRTWKHIN